MSNGLLPISLDTIMEQCGGMAAVVETILDEFLVQAATDVSEMEEKLANGDLLTVSKAAHRLKGTAGVLGAAKLHSLCSTVELAGKEGRTADVVRSLNELKAETQVCVDAVPDIRKLL